MITFFGTYSIENPPTVKLKYTFGNPSETLQKFILTERTTAMMMMFCDNHPLSLTLIFKWIPLKGCAQISIEKGSHLSQIILLDWIIWITLQLTLKTIEHLCVTLSPNNLNILKAAQGSWLALLFRCHHVIM